MAFLNELAFRTWLDTDYLRWYLENGFVIGLVFTILIALRWRASLWNAHTRAEVVG